ncbi:MAG: metallophosphoesterase [Armatimonadetes bacterium]|nr:metallophosphoesterase [Armatimonadota bacterium]
MTDTPRSNDLHTRRVFLKRALLSGASLGVCSFAYANIEPEWVEVERVRIPLPRLSPEFHGYRIAQISDIHMDGWMDRERLSDIVERVNGLKPDLVAITGDFVSYKPRRYVEDMAVAFRRLAPKDGTVAVLGNHDHWTDPEVVRQALRKGGVEELGNRALTLRRRGAKFYVAGVDDPWSGEPHLDRVLKRTPGEEACMLLAHEPDYADTSAATGRFDLQLSGHSHGGQVRVPLYGAIILPKYGRKYPAGLYQVGTMKLYTNRGIGMVGPHLRFNCRPEITLFILENM